MPTTRRPIIGITLDTAARPEKYESPVSYAKSVEKAGGLPLMLPYHTDAALIPQFLDLLDGVLFAGGDDLDPALYGGGGWHASTSPIDPTRQGFEMLLMAAVERRRLPALCICLGCQLLNVYRGGTLDQFLPEVPRDNPIEHRWLGEALPRHPVRVEADSVLGRALGKGEVSANTYHKQAVRRLGRGLRVVARAPDGVIEGVEDASFPLLLGVQWHPERLHEERDHLRLFEVLVEKAADVSGKV